MAVEHVQKGGIGVRFIATIVEDGSPLDISTALLADTKKLLFKRPDGSTLIKDALFVGDGSDGQIYYETEDATILDPPGAGWEQQGYVVITDPRNITVYSEKKGFFVEDNIATVP